MVVCRFALKRIFSHNAAVIALDEPTNCFD